MEVDSREFEGRVASRQPVTDARAPHSRLRHPFGSGWLAFLAVPVSVDDRRSLSHVPTSLIAHPSAGALGGEHVRRVEPQSQIANRDLVGVDHDNAE
jgi:hypothetical protein